MTAIYSTRQVAEFVFGDAEQTWRIQRLFEVGEVPEPPRFAGKRAIPSEMVPQIIDAARRRGWLPSTEAAAK